jgi:hypothetical protein
MPGVGARDSRVWEVRVLRSIHLTLRRKHAESVGARGGLWSGCGALEVALSRPLSQMSWPLRLPAGGSYAL